MLTPLVLHNGITEDEYSKRFPLPYVVRALTPWEQARLNLPLRQQFWEFIAPFAYVSDRFGRIDIPKGFITDFASVPQAVRNLIDDDSPPLLRPSGPHDFLFSQRGRLAGGRTLSFRECNELLAEAMWYCGGTGWQRCAVFDGVQIGGRSHWDAVS